MDKLNKIIEQVLEIKINKPVNYNQVIEWFQDDPWYFFQIQDYNTFNDIKDDWVLMILS